MREIKLINIVFSIFIAILSINTNAQTTIKGNVKDSFDLPIESVAIVLYDTDKNIITYSVTDQKGNYEVEAKKLDLGYFLKIAHMSYLTEVYTFGEDNKQSVYVKDFVLKENTASLDEVILVSSNKVKDTIRLDLEKLNLHKDDNLKDILGKIPNFRLSEDGTIIYRGKSINKILVNNKPSFVNQNSIALESIENKIIEGISVFNNYNEEFTIDFDENQESVLNIDTKKDTQNILHGYVEGQAGYKNKYSANAKGFLFSSNLNAFLTSNTNTIGKTAITSNEVRKLFSKGQPFSSYQGQALGFLFSKNENLKKDFFSSTSITLRNQTQRLKTSGLLYHIAPNRVNNLLQNTRTLDNVPLLNTRNESKSKANSFLGALKMAYRLTEKSILTYELNANYIDNNNGSVIENKLFENGIETGNNTLKSNNLNEIFSSYHQLAFKKKLQKRLISEVKVAYYNESSKIVNNFMEENNAITASEQKFKFSKGVIQGESVLKYKFSDAFIPSLTIGYTNTTEAIKDRNNNNNLVVDRVMKRYNFDFKAIGRNLFKRLDYEIAIGLNTTSNNIPLKTVKKQIVFVPMNLSLDYENKLHRYYLEYARTNRVNALETGINTLQPFNNNWIGNTGFPLEFVTSNNFEIGYNYDDLFDAEIFSLLLSYDVQNNTLRKQFIQQNNGISQFEFFLADKATTFRASTFYSKTVSTYKYPTKIDLGVNYNLDNYTTFGNAQKIDVVINNITPKVKIETINDHLLNFRLTSRVSFIENKVENEKYNSVYTNNTFTVLLKNNNWKGSLSFLIDNNRINEINYSRKNINLEVSYTKNRTTFSIESRHLGELLSVFKNDNYNSQFRINNGIINTIINNESLNYFVLGIKYKL